MRTFGAGGAWLAALAGAAALGCEAGAWTPAALATEAEAASAAAPSLHELDACRVAIVDALAAYRDLAVDRHGRERAQRALDAAARIPTSELRMTAGGCAAAEEWRAAVVSLRDRAVAARAAQRPAPSAADATSAGAQALPPFPSAPYSGLCGTTRDSTEFAFGIKVAFQAAREVWTGFDRACGQVTVVAGFGANTSTACIAADLVLYAAEAAVEDFAFCDGDVDSAEIKGTYDRVDWLRQQLAVMDGKLDDLARAVEGLRTLGCETVRLETTAEGQRASQVPVCGDQPGFPYAWPGK